MYKIKKAESEWVDLIEGARILVNPITTAVMMHARFAIGEDLQSGSGKDDIDITISLTKALARQVITSIEGVEDSNGDPAAVEPHIIDALLDDYRILDIFQNKIMNPFLARTDEKKD